MKTVYQERNRKNTLCSEEIQMTSGIMNHHGVTADNPSGEFRNLIDMLSTKNNILYRECRFDQKKARHIRSMGSILSSMTTMVYRPIRIPGLPALQMYLLMQRALGQLLIYPPNVE